MKVITEVTVFDDNEELLGTRSVETTFSLRNFPVEYINGEEEFIRPDKLSEVNTEVIKNLGIVGVHNKLREEK